MNTARTATLARSALARCAPVQVQRRSIAELRPERTTGLYRSLVEATLKTTSTSPALDVYNGLQRTDIDAPNELNVIDVREPFEFNEEHIEGALYIARGTLERDIESYVPHVSDPVVLFCQNGERSALAAEALGKLGYSNVKIIKNGLAGWKEEGLPTKKTANTFAALSK